MNIGEFCKRIFDFAVWPFLGMWLAGTIGLLLGVVIAILLMIGRKK